MQAQSEARGQMQAIKSCNSSEALSREKVEVIESEDTSAQEKKQEPNSENVDKDKADGQKEPGNPSQAQQEQQLPEPPFSILSPSERRFIVLLASLAALFSPLSANIYYPALNTLSEDLHVSLSKINLTITSYLVWQLNN